MRQMSIDLKKTFPDMSGFSETNLKTMRLWYRFYVEVVNGQQVVDELRSDDIFRLITTIPWGISMSFGTKELFGINKLFLNSS